MSASVNVTENAVPVGTAGTNQQVRNLNATVLINGVATPVIMQVVVLADANGNIVDMNLAKRLDGIYALLKDMRMEMMILNEIQTQWFSATFPNRPEIQIDEEYRSDPMYDIPNI